MVDRTVARAEPVAWIRKNGFRFIAEIEPQDDSEVPLYAAPQPAPGMEKLVEALEVMVEMVEMGGFGKAYAMDVARAALAAHRSRGHDND